MADVLTHISLRGGRSSSIKWENMVMGKCGRCSNNSPPNTALYYSSSVVVLQSFFFMGEAQSHFLNAFISFVMESLHHFLTLATSCVRRQSPLAISLIARKTLWSEEKNSSFSLPLVSFVLCALHTMNYNRVSKQDGCLSSVVMQKKKLSYSV